MQTVAEYYARELSDRQRAASDLYAHLMSVADWSGAAAQALVAWHMAEALEWKHTADLMWRWYEEALAFSETRDAMLVAKASA